jgi:hypothetical protein
MNNSLLLGLWRYMVPIPGTIWRGQVSKGGLDNVTRLQGSLFAFPRSG